MLFYSMKILNCIIVFMFLSFSNVLAIDESIKNTVSQAFDAKDRGDYENAYKLFKKVLDYGPSKLNREQISSMQYMILGTAYDAADKEVVSGNLYGALSWIDKGLELGPVQTNGKVNIYYPALLMLKGAGYYELKKYEESFQNFSKANKYIETAVENDNYGFKNAIKTQIIKGLQALKYKR